MLCACWPEDETVSVDVVLSLDPSTCGTCPAVQIELPGNGGSAAFHVVKATSDFGYSVCFPISSGDRLSDLAGLLQEVLVDPDLSGTSLEPGRYRLATNYFPTLTSLDEECLEIDSPAAAIAGETIVELGKHDNPVRITLTCQGLACPAN